MHCANSRRQLQRWLGPKGWRRMRAPSRLEQWRSILSDNSSITVKLAPTLLPREAVQKMAPYHPPSGGRRNKLRLDFNENTVGASPIVLDFLKRFLTASDLTIYPEYEHALEDLGAHFGVTTEECTLTNG